MAMAKKQSEHIPQKPHAKVQHTSCHTLYKLITAGQKSNTALKWDRRNNCKSYTKINASKV